MKLSELKEYENNPRLNDNAVDKVAKSIKEFGFKVPIIVDKNNVIIAGHTRKKASELLNLETVPVIVSDDLNEEQVKAFRLADNKTNEFADWDWELLENELMDIEDYFTGFNIDDLAEEINPYDFYEEQKSDSEEKEIKYCSECGRELN